MWILSHEELDAQVELPGEKYQFYKDPKLMDCIWTGKGDPEYCQDVMQEHLDSQTAFPPQTLRGMRARADMVPEGEEGEEEYREEDEERITGLPCSNL